MTVTQTQSTGSGEVQGALWGGAAEEWSTLMEPQGRSLFDAVLARGRFGAGARVLDVGCGAGLFAQLAAARGCDVTGFDASGPLLAIARRRTPSASFHTGDMESLPFADESFDIVTGINSFQYAADPRRALGEARRVVKRGGEVFVATWGLPEACEATTLLAALKPLAPPPPPGAGGPFALSDEGALRSFVVSAGLTPESISDVDLTWQFANLEVALAATLSAGPTILAIKTSGRDRVRAAVVAALASFRLSDGSYRLENRFRYLIATRD
jgi:SAM-dependent methyltransferase